MNSYSKIKLDVGEENPRSLDSCSDPLPQTPKPKPISDATPNLSVSVAEKKQEINVPQMVKNSSTRLNSSPQDSSPDHQEGANNNINNGETFGPKLRRNSSVSSAYALQVQAAVKRAFSMRRSSSVSERYCRIHDQSVTLSSPFDDEELYTNGIRRSGKKKNRGKILKAWKSLFGL